MIRWYIRELQGLAESTQRKVNTVAGMPAGERAAVYVETRGRFPQERENAIRSLRAADKDVLGVSDLAVLANNRKDLGLVLQEIKRRGSAVFEARTGILCDPFSAEPILRAVDYWTKRTRTFKDPVVAAAAGRRGGAARGRRSSKARMPQNQAIIIWQDKTLSVDEKVEKMNSNPAYQGKWSVSNCYRHLGKTGNFAGPRGKAKR